MIAHVHRGQQVKAAGAGMSFMRVSPFGMAVELFDQHKERGGVAFTNLTIHNCVNFCVIVQTRIAAAEESSQGVGWGHC